MTPHRLFRQARLVLSAHSAVPVCWALFGLAQGLLAADAGPTGAALQLIPLLSLAREISAPVARALHRRDQVAIVDASAGCPDPYMLPPFFWHLVGRHLPSSPQMLRFRRHK